MKQTLAASSCVLIAAAAMADGKMFWKESIPPDIPYQRAIILFKDGTEILILQSKYRVPTTDADATFGWVVPVPAVPEVASMPAYWVDQIFHTFGLISGPRIVRISTRVARVFYLLGGGIAVLALIFYVSSVSGRLPQRLRERRRRLARIGSGALVVWMVCLAVFYMTAMPRPADGGVDVVSVHDVGIYDVRVVRSDNSRDLVSWLEAHEFRFGEKDVTAFDSYISDEWCFVVANIDPTRAQRPSEISTEGLAAPLILRFPHENPVFPLRLTGTGGFNTEILIYLASDAKMVCDDRMALRFAGPAEWSFYVEYWSEGVDPQDFFVRTNMEYPYLCKFKAILTSDQMERDISFAPAEDRIDYREQIVMW